MSDVQWQFEGVCGIIGGIVKVAFRGPSKVIVNECRWTVSTCTSGLSEQYGFGIDSIHYLSPQHNTVWTRPNKRECLMSSSALQRKFSFALNTQFGEFTIRENIRPDWCRGPNYERLELDFWIEELDVAIEVQGQQHYVYVPHFHGNYEGFKTQQARDEHKKMRCKDYRLLLLEVSDTETFNEAIEIIRDRAKAEKILDNPKRLSKRMSRAVRELRITCEAFCSARHLTFEQTVSKQAQLNQRLKEFRNKHGMGNIFKASEDDVSRIGKAIAEVETRILEYHEDRTLQNGFFPGEEIIWVMGGRSDNYQYPNKGFVLYATNKYVMVRAFSPNGLGKTFKVKISTVVPAIHALYDKSAEARRSGNYTGGDIEFGDYECDLEEAS